MKTLKVILVSVILLFSLTQALSAGIWDEILYTIDGVLIYIGIVDPKIPQDCGRPVWQVNKYSYWDTASNTFIFECQCDPKSGMGGGSPCTCPPC